MPAAMPPFSFASMTLEQKYNMMHSGPGGQAAQIAADGLNKASTDLTEATEIVQSALSAVGMTWHGQSASNFASVIQRVQQWTEQSSQSAQAAGTHVQTYAASYDRAKSTIPNPAELPPMGQQSGAGAFLDGSMGVAKGAFGIQSDYSARQAAWEQANQVANQALTTHASTSSQAVGGVPQLSPPPQLAGGPAADNTPSPTSSSATGSAAGSAAGGAPAGGTAAGGAGAGAGAGAGGGADAGGGQAGGGSSAGGGAPGGTSPSGAGSLPKIGPGDGLPPTGGSNSGGGSGGRGPSATPLLPPVPANSPRGGIPYGGGTLGGAIPGGRSSPPPLAARGEGRLGGAPPPPGQYGGANPTGNRAGGPGGVPMGGMGGAQRPEDKEHRNTVYLPEDSIFYAPIDESDWLVAPAVITPEWLAKQQGWS